MQLVSNISNLYGPDPPTLQTDRPTDIMQSQFRTMHYVHWVVIIDKGIYPRPYGGMKYRQQ